MKTPDEALAYWLEAGGIEPIADDIADLAEQLFERCGHLRGNEAAEAVIEADGDHPWTKIEALIWKAGYEFGLHAGLNFACEQAADGDPRTPKPHHYERQKATERDPERSP